jgi:16S rRNA (uracil1498-N3)-methyltransferase
VRAHFIADLTVQDEYSIIGDSLHHLVNVVRIETDEELLLLNGKGLTVVTRVLGHTKRLLTLKYITSVEVPRADRLDVVLGMPKKEALELSLKQCVELGVGKVLLVKSAYSQIKFPEEDRQQTLLVSALEQSNAAYLPQVIKAEWQSIDWDHYKTIVLMDSQTEKSELLPKDVGLVAPVLLVVGPEGGFSPGERDHLHGLARVKILKLPIPIMRTPTALAAGAGILWQMLLD